MSKIKVYLAGPITDLPELNLPEFRFVASLLEAKGYEVTVPHDLFEGIDTSNFTHEDYMAVCLPEIKKHSVVMFLDGWKESKGSVQEMEEAIERKVLVKFAKNELYEYKKRSTIAL
jgi:nucleoside 2-deoxyribosyltransferase